MACVVAFTLPTSFFLQHYVLYGVPFLAMLGAAAARVVAQRINATAVFTAALVTQAGWSALFYPYTGMAGIICLTPACSLERLGVDEPVYGLREAASWLGNHAGSNDVVVALAAPHVLQSYLENQQVLFMPALPVAPTPQHEVLETLRARFVVGTALSRDHLPPVVDSSFKIAYSTSDRFGAVTIYERRGDRFHGAARSDLTPVDIEPFLQDGNRIQFFGDGAAVRTISTIRGLIQISTLPPAPRLSLDDIGSGTIIAPADTRVAAQLTALYRSAGEIGPDRYAVYRVPKRSNVLPVGGTAMTRTKYNTMKGVARVPQRYASQVTSYRLSLHLPDGTNNRFPRFASAGCVFGRTMRAPVVQTSTTDATAVFPVGAPILKDCRDRHMDVFVETSALQGSVAPDGTLFATRVKKNG